MASVRDTPRHYWILLPAPVWHFLSLQFLSLSIWFWALLPPPPATLPPLSLPKVCQFIISADSDLKSAFNPSREFLSCLRSQLCQGVASLQPFFFPLPFSLLNYFHLFMVILPNFCFLLYNVNRSCFACNIPPTQFLVRARLCRYMRMCTGICLLQTDAFSRPRLPLNWISSYCLHPQSYTCLI